MTQAKMSQPQIPLMNGTRLFLNILLGLLYASTAIMAIASVTIITMLFVPSKDIGFAPADYAMMFSLLGFLLIAITFFRTLRAIVASVAEGDPFNKDNPQRLARLAWLSLFLWVIDLGYIFWDVPALTEEVDALGALAADAINQVFSLIGPITLFILARVFRQGAAMREDLEGTV